MKIPSAEIPQADTFNDVLETVRAISQGLTSYQQIARNIEKVGRQGRYYRDATELLGFVETEVRNTSQLTQLGQALVQTGVSISNPLVLQAVLKSRVFQRLIPFFELNDSEGVSHRDLKDFLNDVAEQAADSTSNRRVSSILSWMSTLELVRVQNDRYFLEKNRINASVSALEFNEIDEPLLPTTPELREYETVQRRAKAAEETITVYRNLVATERANLAHQDLINLVASRLRVVGSIPRYNQLIDLAARCGESDFIFEMKSTTTQNVREQVRAGLSQLYEYRYLQNKPDANLVLVIEQQLHTPARWIGDYLELDREVLLLWDGNNGLFGSNHAMERLPFLNLNS